MPCASDGNALEVTCETFPVLGELKTSELLTIGKALEGIQQVAGGGTVALGREDSEGGVAALLRSARFGTRGCP